LPIERFEVPRKGKKVRRPKVKESITRHDIRGPRVKRKPEKVIEKIKKKVKKKTRRGKKK